MRGMGTGDSNALTLARRERRVGSKAGERREADPLPRTGPCLPSGCGPSRREIPASPSGSAARFGEALELLRTRQAIGRIVLALRPD